MFRKIIFRKNTARKQLAVYSTLFLVKKSDLITENASKNISNIFLGKLCGN